MERVDTAEQDPQLRRDVAPEWDESLPVLHPAPFVELTDEAGETAARRFFAEYLDLLPSRVARVIGGLSSSDVEVSRDALMSLRVTSAMAGAARMEHYCRELEDRLAARRLPDAAGVLAGMSRTSRLILQEGARLTCMEVSPLVAGPGLMGGMLPGPAIPELRVRGYLRNQDTTSLDGTRWKTRGRPDDTGPGNPQK